MQGKYNEEDITAIPNRVIAETLSQLQDDMEELKKRLSAANKYAKDTDETLAEHAKQYKEDNERIKYKLFLLRQQLTDYFEKEESEKDEQIAWLERKLSNKKMLNFLMLVVLILSLLSHIYY